MTKSTSDKRPLPARRRWGLEVAIGLIVLLAVGPYAVSRVRSPGRRVLVFGTDERAATADADPGTIRIVTYNIAHGRGATDDNWQQPGAEKRDRIAAIAEFLAETGADIVVLNEVDFDATWSGHQNQAAALAAAGGFPYRVEQRNIDFRFLYGSWKFGNAILCKFPIVDAQVVELPPHSAWEDWLAGRKRAVVATLKLPGDRRVRVLAAHLEHRREINRVRGAQRIVDVTRASEIPLIAAGDLNSSPPGFPGAKTTAEGANAMTVLDESQLFQRRPPNGPGPANMTYSSTDPKQVIDWILIPSDWTFEDYEVLAGELSDHRAVLATVRLAP